MITPGVAGEMVQRQFKGIALLRAGFSKCRTNSTSFKPCSRQV